jgi:hypothetical protein
MPSRQASSRDALACDGFLTWPVVSIAPTPQADKAGPHPSSQVASVRAQLTSLLSHVMPEAQVAGWLAELIDGRFVPAGTAHPASSPSDGQC